MPVGKMPDIAPNKYLLQGVNRNMIINPYRFSSGGGGGGSTLLTGLEHWWDLDEASGPAIDATGNQDLSVSGSIGTASAAAPDGGNARDLTGGHFTAAAGTVWASGTQKTFGLWFNWDTDATTLNDFLFGHDAVGRTYCILVYSSLSIQVFLDGAPMAIPASSFTRGSWNCLMFTSNGAGSSEVFLNGSSVATGAQNWQAASAIFRLGAYFNGASPIDGKICSAASWDRVLTSAEIAEFYNSGVNLRYADL